MAPGCLFFPSTKVQYLPLIFLSFGKIRRIQTMDYGLYTLC
jgi:hypothetical protein